MNNKENYEIFCNKAAEPLTKSISKILNVNFSIINKTVFSDGEILTSSDISVRNKDAYIIYSPYKSINDSLFELFLFIDSLKRASAKSINVITTYLPYARQDRKTNGRQSIGAKLVANFLERAGTDKITFIDIHNPAIQAFFDIPADDLRGQFIIGDYLRNHNHDDIMVVSPDHGGATRARYLAEILSENSEIAIVDKRRVANNEVKIFGVLGDVKDRNIIIVDDIIDTGSTIIKAAKKIKELGAKKILVAATHGIFSRGFQIFEDCDYIDKVVVSDSIPWVYNIEDKHSKLDIISLDSFIAKVLKVNLESLSIAKIYAEWRKEIMNK